MSGLSNKCERGKTGSEVKIGGKNEQGKVYYQDTAKKGIKFTIRI